MRKLILLATMLILIPLVMALDGCPDIVQPSEVPCVVTSVWELPLGCANYTATLYNASGVELERYTMGTFGATNFCNWTFNHTKQGWYMFNTSFEDTGSILVEGSKMWLLGILLLPIGLGFMFIYLANSLSDMHNPLKWFFRLLALIMVFVTYQGAHIIINLNPIYSNMLDMFDFHVFGWIFWAIMAYILIYLIYKIFSSFKQKHEKKWDWNREFME